MASSAGNPNQSAPFDMHKLFKPPPNPNPNSPNPQPNNPPFPSPFSYPPHSSPYHLPHPYLHYPQQQDPLHHHHHQQQTPFPAVPYAPPGIPLNAPTNPNSGAHLMALLGTSPTAPSPPSTLESAVSMPPSSLLHTVSSGEFAAASTAVLPTAPSAPPAILASAPQLGPARLPSSKQPKGRHLSTGDQAVYDVDVRLSGEMQPRQLEVTPITKYVSDPGLVLGRQIAVNRTYICYGLKLGAIRVLNINTALRSLLRGHNQRVTDMAFFAEDVHLLASASVDGRVFVWKIHEGPDELDKPQITGKVVIAIQIVAKEESLHPRVCWHCHKQEVLVIGIGNLVLKIDTTKVGRGEVFSAEEPLKCPVDKLIDGVQLVGKHDAEVTDLSMSQWMTTRLVSASKDGTIKIWEDRKPVPLVTLRPHDGQPVNSVAFLTAPHRPDHIILITAGPLNRQVKIWASASQEGWLLPSDSESWQCTQTLDLRSSAEPRIEEAFFNQVVVLPQASLILLANAKKNAIYAVHVDYGPNPVSTRMDYIAEFTVTMPILSLTGTSDSLPDGEQVVQVYCVQTQAIQQYALDLSLCLPPPLETVETSSTDGFSTAEHSWGSTATEMGTSPKRPLPMSISESTTAARYPVLSGTAEMPNIHELATSNAERKVSSPFSSTDSDVVHIPSRSVPPSPDVPGNPSGFRSPSKGYEQGASQVVVTDLSDEKRTEGVDTSLSDAASLDENSTKEETKTGPNDISIMQNTPSVFNPNNVTRLVTPSQILSGTVTNYESTLIMRDQIGGETRVPDSAADKDIESVEVEVKVVGENGPRKEEFDSSKDTKAPPKDNKDTLLSSDGLESSIQMTKEYSAPTTEIFSADESRPVEDVGVCESTEQLPNAGEEEILEMSKDVPENNADSAKGNSVAQAPTSKGKKQKAKQSQASGPSSSSASPFNSADSLNEQGSGLGVPFTDATSSQILAMQETLNQLMTMQKEMQKQMSASVAVPITKEGRRVEASLGRSMEKAIKANIDALCARFQEENAKHEKLEKDRVQQITNLITNSLNKDLPAMFEKVLKKEFSAVGSVARALSPVIEKTISSAIADSFQRGVGDKAVNQLEKSVNSKLEATVARQIQAQFQTSGKQALQEALRSTLESSVVPAFEQSCKTMFDQVDAAFQKGMTEHISTAQKQFESTHSSLALTLRDALNSASSITQNLTGELAEGQRKLLAFVASGNQNSLNSMAVQQSNDPLGGLPMVEAPRDPTKELTRLISDQKFEEAFTLALQRSDVSIVSWLCSQVDLQGICSMTPLPLNQGVLLALLQQIACDLGKETSRKLGWMTDVAVVINPADPTIAVHVRPIFEQIYQILVHQRSLPTTTPSEASSIRLILHVINSVLLSCK